jgi:hypothetical protein
MKINLEHIEEHPDQSAEASCPKKSVAEFRYNKKTEGSSKNNSNYKKGDIYEKQDFIMEQFACQFAD